MHKRCLWLSSYECSTYDQAVWMGKEIGREDQREKRSRTCLDMEDEDIRIGKQQLEVRLPC